MNRTVTIESKNHKYANTYGGNICISDFALIMKAVKILQDVLNLHGDLIGHVQETELY